MKNVFLFAGQGSQYHGMGKELYEKNAEFRGIIEQYNKYLKNKHNIDVISYLYKGEYNNCDRLKYSHAALFIIQLGIFKLLSNHEVECNFFCGMSLGEYISLAASKSVRWEVMLDIIVFQAKLIEENCEKGCMITVLEGYHLNGKEIVKKNKVDLVCINTENHYVISLNNNKRDEVIKHLVEKDIRFIELSVRYGFHSSNIDIINDEFKKYVDVKIKYLPINNKIISTVKYRNSRDLFSTYLWNIIREEINFKQSIDKFIDSSNEELVFIDLSPGATLSNFIKANHKEIKNINIISILNPFENEDIKVRKLFSKLRIGKGVLSKMKAFVFPGQGSQFKGMGKDLFDKYKGLVEKADNILGYSIEDLCLYDEKNCLNNTKYTQPALYVVNAMYYLERIKEEGKPAYVAGHSLGEFNALLASGVFDFETGLKIVKRRAELMSEAKVGGMAAIIGLTKEEVSEIISNNNLRDISMANLNTLKQIVISGDKSSIIKYQDIFIENGARNYVVLNVSGAFHSKYMIEARDNLKEFLDNFHFNSPKINIISNYTAREYTVNNIKINIIEQISSTVKWEESIRYIWGKGCNEIEQVGVGNVLVKMINTIKNESTPLIVENIQPEIREDKRIIKATELGNKEFKKKYGLKYAYLSGGMYRGTASVDMVVAMAQNGMMGFFGTGGLKINEIREAIFEIKSRINPDQPYGMNLIHNPQNYKREYETVNLFLENEVKIIEAAAYISINEAIAKYKIKGLKVDNGGKIVSTNRVIAKLSRPEVAENFLRPISTKLIKNLLEKGEITSRESEMAKHISVADEICVEADSGGHTDSGVAFALLPTIMRIKDRISKEEEYDYDIRVGLAGGIGTPEATVAAFSLGADFVLTGSINQCTVEAQTSDLVKEILQDIGYQDTDYAPAGDMFEIGAKVQVVKKGLFFAARANKLYELYKQYNSLDEIDENTKKQLQERYFNKSFDDIFEESKKHYSTEEIEKANKSPKHKMAMIFRWYFAYATRVAMEGRKGDKVNFQIHCGPALGSFNEMVKGTELESWKNRHVNEIGVYIMDKSAEILTEKLNKVFY